MKLTSEQYAQGLFEAIRETSPKDYDLVLDKFVKILVQEGALENYEEIEREYKILENQAKGINAAKVTITKEAKVSRELVDELNKVVGKKLDVRTKVDEGIIGGIVIRVGDTLIDASVRTQLKNLKKSLKE